MTITLLDASSDSLTVSWTESNAAKRYVLQYRRNTSSDTEEFETLSAKLTSTQARKKNLTDEHGAGFFFRVGAIANANNANDDDISSVSNWTTHSEPFYLLPKETEKNRMEAPTSHLAGANEALLVVWKSHTTMDDSKYELQMRETVGGAEWTTIAPSLAGTQVRKKNLSSKKGYQFRVRPSGSTNIPFSPPSDPVVALGLSDGMKQLFRSLEKSTLLRNVNEPIPLVDALGGREFVLLYASASWCGPCRQFTPQLAQWYQSVNRTSAVEVVFLSADHDAPSFRTYFGQHMPWLAVDHDEDTREELMGYIGTQGIPQLCVLDSRTGRILEKNAVGQPLDVNRWRQLAKSAK